MQKSDLLRKVSDKVKDQITVKSVVNALLDEVIKTCQTGDEVCLIGFGRFFPRIDPNISMEKLNRIGSPGHNNQFRLEFRPSNSALKRLNGGMAKIVNKAAAQALAQKASKSRKAKKSAK